MADGKGCKCAAYDQSECGCDADWTPQEVYDLRTENEQLKEAIRRLTEQDATLSVCEGRLFVDVGDTEELAFDYDTPPTPPTPGECSAQELRSVRETAP